MQRRSPWVAILLLGLVPVLAAGLPLPTRLEAKTEAAGLTVHLDPADQAVSAYMVVSHADPLVGSVVDRVIPVDVPLGASLNVSIQQLRPDVNVSVALLDRAGLDGLLTKASSLLNGSLLPNLPSIGQVGVGSLLPSVHPFDLYAYTYANLSIGDVRSPRVLVNHAGVLAVAYYVAVGDGFLGEPMVRLSRDGGHRFEAPIALMPGENFSLLGSEPIGAQVAPDGTFLFVAGHEDGAHQANLDDSQRRLDRVVVARLDPATGVVTRTSTPVLGNDRPYHDDFLSAILDDGTVVIVSGGSVPFTQGDVVVFRLAPDGTLEKTRIEPVPHVYRPGGYSIFAGAHGSAAAVWVVGHDDAPTLRYATTYDFGRTWTTRNVTGLPSGILSFRGAFDNLGTLHLAVISEEANGARSTDAAPWNGPNSTMWYVQAPRVGGPRIASLPWTGDPIHYVASPSIAASGGRAWLLATVRTFQDDAQQAKGQYVQPRTVAWEWLPEPLGMRAPYLFNVTGASFTFDGGTPALLPDGRLVVTGFAGGRDVVPLFDPFPEPACAARNPGFSPAYTGPLSAVQTCGERFSFNLIPGGVSLAPFNAPALAVTPPRPSPPLVAAPPPPAHQVAAPLPPLPTLATEAVAVAGAAGVAVLAVTDAGRYGLGLLAARLFSRVQGKKVLQQPIRGGIYDHIVANPGIRFNRLRQTLGLSHGATAYHLQVLERNGLVRRRTAWTTRHYYPAAGAPPLPAPAADDAILDFVRKNPGAGPAEVARSLGLSRQLAHYHLRRLAAAGRMSPIPDARRP